MSAEAEQIHATLTRGARVFADWLKPGGEHGRQLPSHALRSRVVANGLRELDLFLSLLVDAVSVAHGSPISGDRDDTIGKLRRLGPGFAIPANGYARLQALKRSREALLSHGGMAHHEDPDSRGLMTLGWPDQGGDALSRIRLGTPIPVQRIDLESSACFYQAIADALIAGVRAAA